jgi:hypothetical protein
MEAVLIQCDILSHSRYQLQITIPPPESTVVIKLIMRWTIDRSLMYQNHLRVYLCVLGAGEIANNITHIFIFIFDVSKPANIQNLGSFIASTW